MEFKSIITFIFDKDADLTIFNKGLKSLIDRLENQCGFDTQTQTHYQRFEQLHGYPQSGEYSVTVVVSRNIKNARSAIYLHMILTGEAGLLSSCSESLSFSVTLCD